MPLWKPPYVRLSAFDLNQGTLEWMVPIGDGPRQRVIDLGIPDPGPLATKTLLFLGFRGRGDASDIDFRPVADRDADDLHARWEAVHRARLRHRQRRGVPRAGARLTTQRSFETTTSRVLRRIEYSVPGSLRSQAMPWPSAAIGMTSWSPRTDPAVGSDRTNTAPSS